MSTNEISLVHLYNSLKKDVSKNINVFPGDRKETLLKQIVMLDEKGQEMLYVIIKYHFLEQKQSEHLPYESKFVGKHLRFDFEKLPVELKWMILKFVNMHFSAMEEEKNRLNIQNNLC